MRLYVSGPMTGLPGLNFPAFNKAAADLRERGYDVTNPVDINPDPNAQWSDCLREDIRALMDCDGVATLPNWERSRGASLEVYIAKDLGMPVRPVWAWALAASIDALREGAQRLAAAARGRV